MNRFRTLNANEIDCRISQIKEKDGKPAGLSLLLYKDARCDQNILDETVGPYNWKREHTRDNRNCIVSLWDGEKQQWISKEDTGTESTTEKEKGLASDSFKRACFNWGIGRELYTAPFVWISAKDCNIRKDARGKWACYDRFTVHGIGYTDGVITGLQIKNQATGKICYSFGVVTEEAPEKPEQPDTEPEAIENVAPSATVTTSARVPSGNPVKDFIANELVFMGQMFGIKDKTEMLVKFGDMRKSLVDGGVIPDIPSDKQTLDEAKAMIDAIYKNFKPSGEVA